MNGKKLIKEFDLKKTSPETGSDSTSTLQLRSNNYMVITRYYYISKVTDEITY